MQPPFSASIAFARSGMASTAVLTTRVGNFNATQGSLSLRLPAVAPSPLRIANPPLEQDTIPVRAKKTLLAVVGRRVPRRRPPPPEVNVGPPAASTSDENERFFRTAPIPDNAPTLNKRGQGRRDGTTPPHYEKERFFRSHRITKFHNGVRCTSWHGTRDKKSDAAQRTIIMRTVRKINLLHNPQTDN